MTKSQLLQLIENGRFYHSVFLGGREWMACNACGKVVSFHGHADKCIRGKYEKEQRENAVRATHEATQ